MIPEYLGAIPTAQGGIEFVMKLNRIKIPTGLKVANYKDLIEVRSEELSDVINWLHPALRTAWPTVRLGIWEHPKRPVRERNDGIFYTVDSRGVSRITMLLNAFNKVVLTVHMYPTTETVQFLSLDHYAPFVNTSGIFSWRTRHSYNATGGGTDKPLAFADEAVASMMAHLGWADKDEQDDY